jgi:hypothetical protein
MWSAGARVLRRPNHRTNDGTTFLKLLQDRCACVSSSASNQNPLFGVHRELLLWSVGSTLPQNLHDQIMWVMRPSKLTGVAASSLTPHSTATTDLETGRTL